MQAFSVLLNHNVLDKQLNPCVIIQDMIFKYNILVIHTPEHLIKTLSPVVITVCTGTPSTGELHKSVMSVHLHGHCTER